MARYNFKKMIRALSVGFVAAVGIVAGGSGAIAQNNAISPDGTTASAIEVYSPNPNFDEIKGGAPFGVNLLHSFSDFNVSEGSGAYFYTEPSNISNIFSRVTGSNLSEVYGVLGTSGNSTPDLWLINPNGILFGPNLSLDVSASFFASTANAVVIDGVLPFVTSDLSEDRNTLTINNSVLISNALSNAKIENQSQINIGTSNISLHGIRDSRGLAVPAGESIILDSPEILMNGGGLNASIGSIQLFSNSTEFINSAVAQADNIRISTNQLSVKDGSQILAQYIDPRIFSNVSIVDNEEAQSFLTFEVEELQDLPTFEGSNISISATESVKVTGTDPSGQNSSRIGAGSIGLLTTGGNVSVQTDSLELEDGGQITSDYISVSERNEGGGDINIVAGSITTTGSVAVERLDQTGFFVGSGYTFRESTSGSLNLRTDSFDILRGAQVNLDTSPILVTDTSSLVAKSKPLSSTPGEINIISDSLNIRGLSQSAIESSISTNFSEVTNSINIDVETLTTSEGGEINGFPTKIEANVVRLRDSSRISGDVEIRTDRLHLQEESSIIGVDTEGFLSVFFEGLQESEAFQDGSGSSLREYT